MTSLVLLAGTWLTACTSTQITGKQGFAIDTYAFTTSGEYENKRDWYKDANCTEKSYPADIEKGKVTLAAAITDSFSVAGSVEANFKSTTGSDLGAVWVSEDRKTLRVARGMKNSTMRSTMLGIISFKKK